MTSVALMLVLAAALCHAGWNLLLKSTGAGGPPFLWLTYVSASVIYLPLTAAVVARERPPFGVWQVVFLLGSGVVHMAYFLLLQRGYRAGDLSVVYPLARGTGPALATLAAIVLLDERPAPVALAGAALVVVGVLVLSRPSKRYRPASEPAHWRMIGYPLIAGVFIAAYTLWDAYAVASLDVPPVLLSWVANVFAVAVLGAFLLPQRPAVRATWTRWRREAVGVGVLSPLAYILVLTALVTTPVAYVAPAREVSIAIATILGIALLGERDGRRRLLAAGIILAGVAALAVG